MKNILINKARCKRCGDILISEHRYDFKQCKCKAISVDGGTYYIRRVGKLEYVEELSEYEEDDIPIRNSELVIDRLKIGSNTSIVVLEKIWNLKKDMYVYDKNENPYKVLSIGMPTKKYITDNVSMLLIEGDFQYDRIFY